MCMVLCSGGQSDLGRAGDSATREPLCTVAEAGAHAAPPHADFPSHPFNVGSQEVSWKEGPGLMPSHGLALYLSRAWCSTKRRQKRKRGRGQIQEQRNKRNKKKEGKQVGEGDGSGHAQVGVTFALQQGSWKRSHFFHSESNTTPVVKSPRSHGAKDE